MAKQFRLAIAQLNPTVGALGKNAENVAQHQIVAADSGADMIAFPEMFLSGYPAQDLVLKKSFADDCMKWIDRLASRCANGPIVGVGAPCIADGRLYNAYYILENGEIAAIVKKHHLPNRAVFDEMRHFSEGPLTGPYRAGAIRIGSPICEDAWFDDVCETLVESGAELLLVPNGSPYCRNKMDRRVSTMVSRVVETGLPLVYLNMVGGQDDQVFDGGSFVLNQHGELAAQLPLFDEAIEIIEFSEGANGWRARQNEFATVPSEWEVEYRAMAVGLSDYLRKSGFSKLLLGLSGGADSALVAALAVDAVGPNNVRCVFLPSEFTSRESMEDAYDVALRLGCPIEEVEISKPKLAVESALSDIFGSLPPDVAEENIQSRLRGLLLMAIANKFGELLLTTGNKSEAAVGYATIYGDMAGAYNPIKDLYKTRVFETCRWRNANFRNWMNGPRGQVIPDRVIVKPPTAELRHGQKDTDSLPPYEILDEILDMLIDRDLSCAEVVAAGFAPDLVKRIEGLIYGSEYKRFQSAPGVRLTGRALWLDRRYPIINHWRDSLPHPE